MTDIPKPDLGFVIMRNHRTLRTCFISFYLLLLYGQISHAQETALEKAKP
jgi:hypothetical protein